MQRLVHEATGTDVAKPKAGAGAAISGFCELQRWSRAYHQSTADMFERGCMVWDIAMLRAGYWSSQQRNDNICNSNTAMVQGVG
jgi:hypothetical protein